MTKVNRSFLWLLVTMSHAGAEVADEMALLLKLGQFLLVLVTDIPT